MKNRALLTSLLLIAGSCRRPEPPPKAETPKPETVSVTRWSERTEVFAEYPALVASQTSRFAIHFTRLDNFRAVRQGAVEVRLERDGVPAEVFRATEPSRPGIFGVDVKPAAAGAYRMSIAWSGEGMADTHALGPVNVAASGQEIVAETDADSGDEISFLKEQQWTLDFATAVVATRSLRESLRVPAEVTARSGGEAVVSAPFDGRLVLDRVPETGTLAQAGQVLGSLALPTPMAGDPAALELARSEAAAHLEFARKDRARAERLVASGAAPARRLEEARAAEQTAEARLRAAQARLVQFDASARAEAGGNGARLFALRAPIRGIVQQVNAAAGANVKAGAALFTLVDLDLVYVSAIVPESEFPRMRELAGAELEVPGQERPQRLNRLVTIGRVVDAPSRTFPVVYAVDNRGRLVAINQTVHVRLLLAGAMQAVAVPESALVDDGGRPIVFVQKSGEAFARRPVKLGVREGGYVQVLDGVRPGDRVVVKGAHLIRLASLSSQVPAHGHVH